MKTIYTVALAFSILFVSTHAADIRRVNGIAVDLDPIHRWMRDRTGERPMHHWRNFTPVDYLGPINGCHAFRVVVAIDGDPAPRLVAGIRDGTSGAHITTVEGRIANSETKEILLKNPPLTMLRLGMKVRDLKTRLDRAESTEIAAERGRAVAAGNARIASDNVPTFAFSRHQARASYARAQQARNAHVRAQTALTLTKIGRQALEEELRRCVPQFRETHDLAMFTGQMIAGREVWDCGTKIP